MTKAIRLWPCVLSGTLLLFRLYAQVAPLPANPAPVSPTLAAGLVEHVCASGSRYGSGGPCDSARMGPPTLDPSRYTCPLCNAHLLLVTAFNLSGSAQVRGAPIWMGYDVYHVEIVPSAPATHEQMMALLRTAFIQAFGLKYHMEEDPSPVFRLVVGKGGPKFHASDKAVSETREAMMNGEYDFANMAELIRWLNQRFYVGSTLHHPVEDGTGLSGNYDIALKLGPGIVPNQAPLLELVKQQLGLEAELVQGHAEFLAIDSIEHFTGKRTFP